MMKYLLILLLFASASLDAQEITSPNGEFVAHQYHNYVLYNGDVIETAQHKPQLDDEGHLFAPFFSGVDHTTIYFCDPFDISPGKTYLEYKGQNMYQILQITESTVVYMSREDYIEGFINNAKKITMRWK